MSKKCELTGKSPLKGYRVSHANNKTKRKQEHKANKNITNNRKTNNIKHIKYNKT